ncbi:hypothetical protein FRB99_003121 [Tulasnella sp. 403]|nr:hypothetical protein FRB99_003121 [Tulasnella sp. 403]
MISLYHATLLLPPTAAVIAAPLFGPTVTPRLGSFDLARRDNTSMVSTQDTQDFVFDPSYPQHEIHKILQKYKYAADLIHNPNLPDPLSGLDISDDLSDALNGAYNGQVTSGNSGSKNSLVPLTDSISGNLDVLYYGPLELGSAGQELTFDFDTGSADLWVRIFLDLPNKTEVVFDFQVPVNCQNCHRSGYNAAASKSYKSSQTPFLVTYGSGSVSGTLAQDRVAAGSLFVDDQYFGAVDNESQSFQSGPNDGLIGMAFSSIASSGKATFVENLLAAKKLAAPIFSVHLARRQVQGSAVCLGCYDSSKAIGPVSWVPVVSKTYWAVSMPQVFVNSNPITLARPLTAAIDTGTTLIYVPKDIASALYNAIPGAKEANQYGDGFYTYPCDIPLNISLQLGSNSYALDLRDFNLGRTASGSSDCVGGILALGDGFPSDLAIVGDEFLKSWYSVYDYSHGARVGFAKSVNNS